MSGIGAGGVPYTGTIGRSTGSTRPKEGPPPSNACVQLNRSITTLGSAQEILAICDTKLDEFDTVNIVTALHRLGRFVPQGWSSGSRAQERLIQRLSEQITELRVQQLANTIWALARVQVRNQPITAAIAESSVRNCRQFGPQECANIAWSCAKLEFCDDSLLEAISIVSIDIIRDFLSQHLGNIAWACARLKYVNAHFLDVIAEAATPLLAGAEQQEISNIVWAFAKLGVKNEKLMDAISSLSVGRVCFNAQGLSNMAW
eukprot:TRINITY_DN35854_c0_g1_i1.p1 TRINITY_DN35854_c0_g1~~TRINITY_DN35854_c0_g1_i1.p1  ORF type:complete len:260 (-),score=37.56 TRINITY_DN35854_c0_g1_i1:560-1339(-)